EYYFNNIPHVVRLVIFGVQDGAYEKITMAVQLDNNVTPENIKETKIAIDNINATLPAEKRVKDFYVYKKDMPLANGIKVKRAMVKKAVIEGSADVSGFEGKRESVSLDAYDPAEAKAVCDEIRQIFANTLLLPLEQIGDEAIWTVDLGGDSMGYISMVADLNEQMGLEIPTEKLGKLGCVKDFAAEVLRIRHEGSK
ncbi:MAG: acyl carrier protein, partial [Bacilli bacterium]|nr:acyl carrier protein [Bacilli bacterium]